MKAIYMTQFWNAYISFTNVSHFCFRQGIQSS